MTDSKSGSKDNLNESNMPLLESEEKAEETPEKEVVEMELEEKEEKKDEVTLTIPLLTSPSNLLLLIA